MDVPFTVQLIVVKKKPCVQEKWILLDVKSQIIVILAVRNYICCAYPFKNTVSLSLYTFLLL